MADMTAEEAFLKSMRDQADAESVQYGAGAADEKQTESTSSDEYDPAKAVPDTFSPYPAQDSSSSLSHGVVKQNPSLHSHDRSPTAHGNVAATGPQDQAVDDDDGRSQSRSMSGSSSSSSPPVNIQTNNVPFKVDVSAHSAVQEIASLQQSSASAEGAVQAPQSPAVPSPDPALNNAANDVQSQINLSVQKPPEVVQNGLAQTVSQSSASLPESGREAPSEAPAEKATTLSAPQESETKASALPKARLPHDKIGILEDRTQEDPRGDMDAWLSLISEYRMRSKIPEARATYERFFTVFPAAVSIRLNTQLPLR